MNKKIKIWALGDDDRANEFINNNFWEIGFDEDTEGFDKYIQNLNELSENDIVVLKSKYVNSTTKDNYLKVFAIGIIINKKDDKSINIKWLEKFTDDSSGFKKIDNVIYGKTLEIIKKESSIVKIFGTNIEEYLKLKGYQPRITDLLSLADDIEFELEKINLTAKQVDFD